MDVDTDALRWLQQVADGTTVTEVGGLESVTQSGVSRALARLEAQIGTPLLRRSGRTLRMTHAGAVFKPHLDALLHNLDDGIAAVSQLHRPGYRHRGAGLPAVPGRLARTRPGPQLPHRAPARPAFFSSPRCATSRTRPPWTTASPTSSSAHGGRTPRRGRGRAHPADRA